jgi:hypothetical protein
MCNCPETTTNVIKIIKNPTKLLFNIALSVKVLFHFVGNGIASQKLAIIKDCTLKLQIISHGLVY